jgi:polyisoprenoid-binding protein YceI
MRLFNLVIVISALTWSVAADAAKYTFDQTGSSVTFHNTASLHGIDGTAKQFSGSFDSDAGTGSLVVQTKSMTTNLGPRDTKMHEFCLESEKFPTIEFAVTGMGGGVDALKAKAKKGKLTLNGTLKIRDSKKPISVSTSFVTVGDDLTLQGQFDFSWQDYNVPDPSIFISTLYPDMSVKFSLRLKGEPAPAEPVAPAEPAEEAPAGPAE